MAYVPPHKRLSKTQDGPSPTPAQLVPKFKKSVNLHSSRSSSKTRTNKSYSYGNKIRYATHFISRWMAVLSVDDVQLPSSLRLVPVCIESTEQKAGQKPLTLVKGPTAQEHHDTKSCHSEVVEHTRASVAEIIHADLLSVFQHVRNELANQTLEETKPNIVARFGKVMFHRNPSCNLDCINENSVSESYIKNLGRKFYTDVPIEYVEHIKRVIVPKLGVHFEEEKELYHLKLTDAKRPDTTIRCKCRVQKDEKKLELYKVELDHLRHLIVDISCLENNVDLRLALCTKRILTALRDEEEQDIRDLINSAIFDPNVKGGLRWPLGKANSGGHYSVVGVWHTKSEVYSSSLIRIRMREADRYDFHTSTGEVSREIILKLPEITRNLLEQNEAVVVSAMLEDALKLIQNHFLAWDGNLVSSSES